MIHRWTEPVQAPTRHNIPENQATAYDNPGKQQARQPADPSLAPLFRFSVPALRVPVAMHGSHRRLIRNGFLSCPTHESEHHRKEPRWRWPAHNRFRESSIFQCSLFEIFNRAYDRMCISPVFIGQFFEPKGRQTVGPIIIDLFLFLNHSPPLVLEILIGYL